MATLRLARPITGFLVRDRARRNAGGLPVLPDLTTDRASGERQRQRRRRRRDASLPASPAATRPQGRLRVTRTYEPDTARQIAALRVVLGEGGVVR